MPNDIFYICIYFDFAPYMLEIVLINLELQGRAVYKLSYLWTVWALLVKKLIYVRLFSKRVKLKPRFRVNY